MKKLLLAIGFVLAMAAVASADPGRGHGNGGYHSGSGYHGGYHGGYHHDFDFRLNIAPRPRYYYNPYQYYVPAPSYYVPVPTYVYPSYGVGIGVYVQ